MGLLTVVQSTDRDPSPPRLVNLCCLLRPDQGRTDPWSMARVGECIPNKAAPRESLSSPQPGAGLLTFERPSPAAVYAVGHEGWAMDGMDC